MPERPISSFRLPFADLIGVHLIEVTPERAVAELTVREDLCTRPDVLHGGVFMALADILGAVATIAGLPEGAHTTTIESKTNFLGPAALGTKVIAECTPVHRGRRTHVWQTLITSEAGRLLANVIQTQLIL